MKRQFQILSVSMACLLTGACMQQPKQRAPRPAFSRPVKVVMISMPDSSASLKMRSRLQAIAHEYQNFSYIDIDVLLLPDDDPRLAYGAPTILYKGKDIFGKEPRKVDGISSRTYDDVVPSENEIVKSIQKMVHQSKPEPSKTTDD
mgnify:CR=1 FL=1